MSGRAEAKEIVKEMGKQNGYISDELLATMRMALPKKDFDEILEALGNLKHKAAISVKTLAQNLYSSSAKFVFELLQNYDDNNYSSANGPPSVEFHIYADRIVASCNEEGFTAENVKAICGVGQSSKKQTQSQLAGDMGYTGEKGIGFKSVFMAAEEVHIQSGNYSFRFKYAKGDSGLGMTTPIWTDHDEELDDKLSHITLTLRSDGRPGDAARRQEIIHEQFHNIHDSILLFMKKLQHIKVSFYDPDERVTSTTDFSIDRQSRRTAVKKSITTYDEGRGKVEDVVKSYIMIKHIVKNLAPSENRKELDGESNTVTNGVVVLGFPVDEQSVPVLQNEHIFAFLPVKQMGFKFLIHADFVTQANREDIITTSDRNRGLGRGIAEAFIKAILEFLDHYKLQFQWMRYLPHDNDYPWDGFWKSVIGDIRNRLAQTPIMLPAIFMTPRLIRDSRRLLPSMLDSKGAPLIPDIQPRRYLSQGYESKDLLLLKDYGLEDMSISDWVELVSHDLASGRSVMKSTTDEDWHCRVADLLYSARSSRLAVVQNAVSQLQLCPLRDGRWVSVSSGPVYYPKLEGTSMVIPIRTNMAVMDATAVGNVSRRRLFDRLGVQTTTVQSVREAIFKEYEKPFSFSSFDLGSHVHFLYLTHHLVSPPYGYDRLFISPRKGYMRKSGSVDMYIADGAPYGVELLLPTDDGAPGLEPIFVLKDYYFEDVPSPPTSQSPTWKEWLHKFISVRRHLRLVDADGKSLSAVGKYVIEHRPEKFLGFLQSTWGRDKLSAANEKLVIEQISNLKVLCKGGEKVRFGSTYLPFRNLVTLSDRFLDGEFFPWLQLESDISNDDDVFPSTWVSLGKAFGLGYRCTTTSFLLDILRYIRLRETDAENTESGPEGEVANSSNSKRIYELYVYLQAEVRAARPNDGLQEMIRVAFNSNELIYMPETETEYATWYKRDECVWEAPVDMRNIFPIARRCEKEYPKLYAEENSNLQNFFSRTLKIRDANWHDFVSELIYMYNEDIFDFEKADGLYTSLSECYQSLPDDELRKLKKYFLERRLIYVADEEDPDDGKWYSPETCLWASATKIRGMVTLNDIYPDLKTFFVDGLGVQTMTAKMVYDKLIGPELTVDETKQTIHTFNSLLENNAVGRDMDPAAVFEKKVFPVRLPGGAVRLCQGNDHFALVDRQSLADQFSAQAKFLDFDLDEVRSLLPFIEWVGLKNKYLSQIVKEISGVAGDDRRPILLRDRDIRNKARALFSLAVAYRSPRTGDSRDKSFYALLRHAETIEIDRITSELHLHQDGKVLKVERAAATFHIQEDEESLKFYVPQNEILQELCFNTTLPQNICLWLMTNPRTQIVDPIMPSMVSAALAILSAKRTVIEGILDHNGIKMAPVPEGEEDEEEEEVEAPQQFIEEADSIEQVDEVVATSQPLLSVPRQRVLTFDSDESAGDSDDDQTIFSSSQTPFRRQSQSRSGWLGPSGSNIPYTYTPPTTNTTVTDDEELYISDLLARTRISSRAASSVPQAPSPTPQDNSYTVILNRLVEAAGKGVIPTLGNVFMSIMPSTGVQRDNKWFRDATLDEKYKKIGAAGELFVYSLLSSQSSHLPGFSLGNWQSTIRGYARSHTLYSNIENWVGEETADITYNDVEGTLTALLIEKGYLASDVWSSARPFYYIEVKTTVNRDVGTPFFMSNHQYTRMQNCSAGGPNDHDPDHDPLANIYMIIRVFGLGAGFVGFQLLVDPESMRRRGELAFTAPESWTVVVLERPAAS